MKQKKILIMATIILIICFGTIARLNANQAYDLTGEWDAVITKEGANVAMSITIEKDIIKISQQGNQFVGIRTNGGKWVGKNEEMIKGKLLYKMVDEVFINHMSDPITYAMSWSDGRATITEAGNKIVIQSFVNETGYYETVTLTRK
ncbi:MAG: hypothetical protein QNK33_00665 [Bacteroidales bacterium]|nr:hypothetical protein [Bacteroidales bacterium]